MFGVDFWPDRASAFAQVRPRKQEPKRSICNQSTACEAERELPHVVVCDGVIDMIAQLFELPVSELRATTRSSQSIARVRQIGMYVCHVALCMPMSQVAEGFSRDRSTVFHACQCIEDLRDEPEIDRIVAKVEAVVRIAFADRLRQE